MTSQLRYPFLASLILFSFWFTACGRANSPAIGIGREGLDGPGPEEQWGPYEEQPGPSFIPNGIDPNSLKDGDPYCVPQQPGPDGTVNEICELPQDQVSPRDSQDTLGGLSRLIELLRGRAQTSQLDPQMISYLMQRLNELRQRPRDKQALGQALMGMVVQKSCAKGAAMDAPRPDQQRAVAQRRDRMRGRRMAIAECFMQTMQRLRPKLQKIIKNLNGTALKMLKKQAM